MTPPKKQSRRDGKRVDSDVRDHNTFYGSQSVRGTYYSTWEQQCIQNHTWCANAQTYGENKPQRRSESTKTFETTIHAVSCTGHHVATHGINQDQRHKGILDFRVHRGFAFSDVKLAKRNSLLMRKSHICACRDSSKLRDQLLLWSGAAKRRAGCTALRVGPKRPGPR